MDKGESGVNQPVEWVRSKVTAVKEFYVETRLEMKRVTWPTRQQVQSTTIVVIVTVFFFGFYLGAALDVPIAKLMTWLLKVGRTLVG